MFGKCKIDDSHYSVVYQRSSDAERLDIASPDITLIDDRLAFNSIIGSIFLNKATGEFAVFGDRELMSRIRTNVLALLHRDWNQNFTKSSSISGSNFISTTTFEQGDYFYRVSKENNTFSNNEVYKSPGFELELYARNTDPQVIQTIPNVNYLWIDSLFREESVDSIVRTQILTYNELIRLYDLSWLANKQYYFVDTWERFDEIVTYLEENCKDRPVAFDYETSGLAIDCRPHYPVPAKGRDVTAGFSFTWQTDLGFYVPFNHFYTKNIDEYKAHQRFKNVLENWDIITQRGIFEAKIAHSNDVEINIKSDPFYGMYICNPDENKRGARAMKDNVRARYGIHQLSLHDLETSASGSNRSKREVIDFRHLDERVSTVYACPDVDYLIPLARDVEREIPKDSRRAYEVELSIIVPMAVAEFYGVCYDKNKFAENYVVAEKSVNDLLNLFHKVVGKKINPKSPEQLKTYFYTELGLEIEVKNKSSGAPSTGAKALKHWAKQTIKESQNILTEDLLTHNGMLDKRAGKKVSSDDILVRADEINYCKVPAALVLKQYKKVQKDFDAYFKGTKETAIENRIIKWIKQEGSGTSRIITPLQQASPSIKKMIVADSDDFYLFDNDQKQVELRIMFCKSKEKTIVQLAFDPDLDLHRAVYSGFAQKEIWAISKGERDKAKGIDFGVPYWLGDRSLAEVLFGLPITAEKISEAIRLKNLFFKTYKRTHMSLLNSRAVAAEKGYADTDLGFIRYFPKIHMNPSEYEISSIQRQAVNTPIQGWAAQNFKRMIARCYKEFKRLGWTEKVELPSGIRVPKVRMATFIHDEIFTVNHKSIHPIQLLHVMRSCMEVTPEGWCPLYTGPAFVDNWYEAKSGKYEIPITLADRLWKEYQEGMHQDLEGKSVKKFFLDQIAAYQTERIKDEMAKIRQDLYTKNKRLPSNDEIAKAFRHPVLSHDILPIFKDEIKAYETNILGGLELEHCDAVAYAAKCFLESNQDIIAKFSSRDDLVDEELTEESNKDIDEVQNEEYDDYGGIIEDEDNEEFAQYQLSKELREELPDAYFTKTGAQSRINHDLYKQKLYLLGKDYYLNLAGLTDADKAEIIVDLTRESVPDGICDVYACHSERGDYVLTGIRVDFLDNLHYERKIEQMLLAQGIYENKIVDTDMNAHFLELFSVFDVQQTKQ